ncbi:MAG TPA: type II secretion system F family protein [Gemmatimonadaceae bacterium]|nr:type II secretion system F family protein [Gemmatimonadaceae bacterium]
MPEFWYSALTDAGVVQEGRMSAPNENALADQLRAAGAFLIRTEVRDRAATAGRPAVLTDGTIDRKDLLAFLEYVAGSFDVGIPMLDTLDDVVNRLQSKKLKAIVTEIRFAVSEEGKSLSAALAEHPKAFPELYIGTIRAGEASGELGYALRQLVEYMDWQENISSQMKQATAYPAIVLSAVGLLVIGLLGFVFPRITPLLRVNNIELPLPTRIILAVSGFVHDEWLIWVTGIILLAVGVWLLRRSESGRLAIDGLVLRIPIVGHVIRDVYMARIVTYLALFYRTGVELVLSLTIVERIIANRAVARDIAQARALVTEGVSMAAAFGRSPLFPQVVIRAIALGEATGNLDAALTRAKDYYEREIPAAVRRMIIVLQPLLIAFIGGVILMVALAIILPILNIYNSIGVRR